MVVAVVFSSYRGLSGVFSLGCGLYTSFSFLVSCNPRAQHNWFFLV